MDASQVIQRIAEVANAMSFQSGEPGLETAGMIVSCLASRPELADAFMEKGAGLFIDGDLDFRRDMSLSYRSIGGDILDPKVLRDENGHTQ